MEMLSGKGLSKDYFFKMIEKYERRYQLLAEEEKNLMNQVTDMNRSLPKMDKVRCTCRGSDNDLKVLWKEPSAESITSVDCIAITKMRQLIEKEKAMKRQIEDLEQRETMYRINLENLLGQHSLAGPKPKGVSTEIQEQQAPPESELPVESEEPQVPAESELPAEIEEPQVSADSEHPAESEEPQIPEDSELPVESEASQALVDSELPAESEEPQVPADSELPVESEEPQVLAESELPVESEEPQIPAESELPVESEKPQVPAHSELPVEAQANEVSQNQGIILQQHEDKINCYEHKITELQQENIGLARSLTDVRQELMEVRNELIKMKELAEKTFGKEVPQATPAVQESPGKIHDETPSKIAKTEESKTVPKSSSVKRSKMTLNTDTDLHSLTKTLSATLIDVEKCNSCQNLAMNEMKDIGKGVKDLAYILSGLLQSKKDLDATKAELEKAKLEAELRPSSPELGPSSPELRPSSPESSPGSPESRPGSPESRPRSPCTCTSSSNERCTCKKPKRSHMGDKCQACGHKFPGETKEQSIQCASCLTNKEQEIVSGLTTGETSFYDATEASKEGQTSSYADETLEAISSILEEATGTGPTTTEFDKTSTGEFTSEATPTGEFTSEATPTGDLTSGFTPAESEASPGGITDESHSPGCSCCACTGICPPVYPTIPDKIFELPADIDEDIKAQINETIEKANAYVFSVIAEERQKVADAFKNACADIEDTMTQFF